MKKRFTAIVLALVVTFSPKAKADMWGADIPILLDILAQNISQLYQLYAIVQQTQDSLSLMRDINSGIDSALGVINVIRNRPDAGLYGDWQSVDSALRNIQQIYGSVPRSPLSEGQENTDRNVAEAINMHRALFESAENYDQVGQRIQSHSQSTSPKGAAKMTAQGVGVMVQVMNESLRAQASGLKLQAQSLENENQKNKEETRQMQSASKALSTSLKTYNATFTTPQF